jgi:hypothetical protein
MVLLPASVIGNPTTFVTGDNAIEIGADSPVQFMPPGEAIDVAELMQQLNGTPTGNWFELQKQVLATQPFSFWKMLKMGSKQTLTTVELLMIKASMAVGTATDVQIAEANGIGAIIKIIDKPEIGVMVEICDLQHSTMQVVLIDQAMMGNWREIVSALLSDYSMPLADYSEAAIKRLIDEAKIPPAPPREMEKPGALTPAR